MMHDDDLIDELHDAMRERADSIDARDDLTTAARRAARRRTTTRVASLGAPVLVAAGVTAAFALTGGGSAVHHAASPRGSAPQIAVTPAAHAQDTAYIVKRVRARLASGAGNDMVFEITQYAGGTLSSSGTPVDVGKLSGNVYQYTAPDGTVYSHQLSYNASGSTWLTDGASTSRTSSGPTTTYSVVNDVTRTYSQGQRPGATPDLSAGPGVTLASSSARVRRELESGKVTQVGTTTVDGTPAIVLSETFAPTAGVADSGATQILDVDARTYAPLRLTVPGLATDQWLPATAQNVALAEQDPIPAGYAKVANALDGSDHYDPSSH